MRTTLLLLLLLPCLAPAAVAGERAREIASSRATGPNMRWFYVGPDGTTPPSPLGFWHRPHYDRRTKVYYNNDGSIAAYPVKVKPHRIDYVVPRR